MINCRWRLPTIDDLRIYKAPECVNFTIVPGAYCWPLALTRQAALLHTSIGSKVFFCITSNDRNPVVEWHKSHWVILDCCENSFVCFCCELQKCTYVFIQKFQPITRIKARNLMASKRRWIHFPSTWNTRFNYRMRSWYLIFISLVLLRKVKDYLITWYTLVPQLN